MDESLLGGDHGFGVSAGILCTCLASHHLSLHVYSFGGDKKLLATKEGD